MTLVATRRSRRRVPSSGRRMSRRRFLRASFAGAGLAAAAPMLAACGGTDDAGGGIDPGSDVSISYWRINTGDAAILQALEDFNGANPNISAEEKVYPDFPTMVEAVQAGLAGGEPPALAWIGYNYLRYAADNLPHLTIDEAAQLGGDGDYLAKFPPEVLELGRVDGAQHGLPWGVSTPMVYYNADLLAEAGIGEAPDTWDGVREAARRLSEASGRASFVIGAADPWQYQAIVESNGGRLLEGSEGEWRTGIDGPEAVEAMQLVHDMAVGDETLIKTNYEQGIQSFTSGQAAMLFSSSAVATNIEQGSDFEVGGAPSPTFGEKPRRIPAGSGNFFIFAEDEQQQLAAWKLARFFNTPEVSSAWTRESGIFPSRLSLVEDPKHLEPFFEDNRVLQAAIDQLEDIVPYVSWPGQDGLEASQVLFDACNRIAAGDEEPEAALRSAAGRINGIIG